MTEPDQSQFDENERALLRQAHPPVALDEKKLQATLERARSIAAERTTTRRWRKRLLFGFGLCAAALAVQPFFGVFGSRSTEMPATLSAALEVTERAADYDRGQVQAAMHKLYRVTHRLLVVVKTVPTLDQRTRDAVREALAAPIGPVQYDGSFEALLDKVEHRVTLTEAEITQLTTAARASVAGLRHLGDAHALHAAEIRILCNYLAQEASPAESDPGGKQRTRQH